MSRIRNYLEKQCRRCGKVFKPVYARTVYCSDECRRGRSTCKICGKDFLRTKNTTGGYCSPACWNNDPNRARQIPDRNCAYCQVQFRPKTSDQFCCGEECGHLIRRKERRSGCERCGGPLHPKASARTRFCSVHCSMLGRDRKGNKPAAQGTQRITPQGYAEIKVGKNWVKEHRHVMEQVLGRVLHPKERVHHLNGQKTDNRPENLELWKLGTKDPTGIRAKDYHCVGCRCFQTPEQVEGRCNAFLETYQGRVISAEALTEFVLTLLGFQRLL